MQIWKGRAGIILVDWKEGLTFRVLHIIENMSWCWKRQRKIHRFAANQYISFQTEKDELKCLANMCFFFFFLMFPLQKENSSLILLGSSLRLLFGAFYFFFFFFFNSSEEHVGHFYAKYISTDFSGRLREFDSYIWIISERKWDRSLSRKCCCEPKAKGVIFFFFLILIIIRFFIFTTLLD